MATIILLLLLTTFPMLTGLWLMILWKKERADKLVAYLTGVLFLFCVVNGAVFLADLLHKGFAFVVIVTSAIWVLAAGGALALRYVAIRTWFVSFFPIRITKAWAMPSLLIVLWLVSYVFIEPVRTNDMTLETVQTILGTGTVYEYHPLTGALLEEPMYFVTKFQILPVFYAYLCRVTGMQPQVLVHTWMPIWVFAMASLVVVAWARRLFACTQKRQLFYSFWLVLLLFGTYAENFLGYRVAYSAWQGDTVVFWVFVPYLLYLCVVCLDLLRVQRKEWKVKKDQAQSKHWKELCSLAIYWVILLGLQIAGGISIAGITVGGEMQLSVLALFAIVAIVALVGRRRKHATDAGNS